MSRKWLQGGLLTVILAGMIFAILWLNDPDLFKHKKADVNETSREPVYIEYQVDMSPVHEMCTCSGVVISGIPDLYMETMILENVNEDRLDIRGKKGDTVSPGQVILVHRGTEFSVSYHALITDITTQESEGEKTLSIQLLNYDKLYVTVAVDTSHIDRIRYDTPVKLTVNGKEYNSEVRDIGYEVSNETVAVALSVPPLIRPGTAAKAVFITGTHEGMTVPRDFVFQDMSGQYYVKQKTDNGFTRVDVNIGEAFAIEENGTIWEYIEVVSGISEGDTLLTEMNTSVKRVEKLKESLKNE